MSIWHKPDERPIQRKWIVVKYRAPIKATCKFVDKDTYISPVCDYAYLDDLIAQADKAERLQKAAETLIDFITKLYLNGNITDEQLERYKNKLKKIKLEQKSNN